MKRKIVILLILCISTQLMTGCQKTPDEVIVKEKNKNNMSAYETAEDTQTSLREQLNVPENYKSELSFLDGAVKIDTDATVIIPDVNSVDTISVRAKELDQEMIDKITKTFFGDALVYDGQNYFTMTKAQLEEQIATLKNYVAQGNMDPYGYDSRDVEGGYTYDINGIISNFENMLKTAPETVEKKQVKPQFGLPSEYLDDDGNVQQTIMEDFFQGVVETEKAKYDYRLQRDSKYSILFLARITQLKESQDQMMEQGWIDAQSLLGANGHIVPGGQGFTFSMTEDDIIKLSNISYEDAKTIADEKVKALGLEDIELDSWGYSLFYIGRFAKENIKDGAYNFHYTRKINGFPISYTLSSGGATEEMESTIIPWGYEVIDILVGDDGIMDVAINNIYDIGEVQNENVKLMNFTDIIKIYEQMMEVSNASLNELEKQRTYHITKIKLGYSRLYDPKVDNKTGTLVPVWDFYGSFDMENKDGTSNKDNGKYSSQSIMTINAVDGTLINRELGY